MVLKEPGPMRRWRTSSSLDPRFSVIGREEMCPRCGGSVVNVMMTRDIPSMSIVESVMVRIEMREKEGDGQQVCILTEEEKAA
jgi:transposase